MKTPSPLIRRMAALALLLSIVGQTAPAWAEKPDWAGKGHGKPDKHERHGDRDDDRDRDRDRGRDEHRHRDERPRQVYLAPGSSVSIAGGTGQLQVGMYFGAPQRQVLYDYYRPQFHGAKCPPGLAKKGNGCLPPGQARKWRVGYPLPQNVVYYAVPNEVSVRIGVPPPGYRYVRVAADILMIAVGTGMVIDAVDDLMR